MWVRLGGAAAALLVGSLVFAITMATKSTAGAGQSLFATLTFMACFAALSTGLAFTCDTLSEEKRDGTLGFLFLTDLRGYDVVSGKLLAAGLRGFYMLLAAFPIVGITLLMGGVSGATFWKTCLALINALFVSLVAGMFISSISREAQKAMLGTLLLMFLWTGAGYIIDAVRSQVFFRLVSPFFLFTVGGSSGSIFWESLLVNQAIAWTLFAASCFLASRTWHDKPTRGASPLARFNHWLKYGGARRRTRLRLKLMPLNPVAWLACRERWQAISFWAIAGIMVVVLMVGLLNPVAVRAQIWSVTGTIMTIVLYVGFASQSCRFFADARRNTVLELLLSTPLSGQQIIRGQWQAVLRMFGPPLAVFLAIYFLGALLVVQTGPSPNPVLSFAAAAGRVVVVAADLATLTWFGMWMGLISKNVNTAAWKTLFFVQVLPWVALSFVSGMVVALMFVPGIMGKPRGFVWLQAIGGAVTILGSLVIDWCLFRYAHRRLSSELRLRAAAAQGRGG